MLTLPTKYTAESLANCHAQEQCPLFSKLPGELRNRIFEFACAPSEDPNHRYEHTDYWFRPGYHAKPKYETNLLRTCRRIWIESHSLPIALAVPTFWFADPSRAPVWSRTRSGTRSSQHSHEHSEVRADDIDEGEVDSDEDYHDDDDDSFFHDEDYEWSGQGQGDSRRLTSFLQLLTPQNHANLQCLRIFAQMFWLEGGSLATLAAGQHNLAEPPFPSRPMWPREIIITIRHTDWWFWESDENLRMNNEWIRKFLELEDLEGPRVFRLELETLKVAHNGIRDWSAGGWRSADPGRKVAQMQQIIDNIKSQHGVVGQWRLKPDSGKEIMTWTRPGNVDGEPVDPQSELTQLVYVVYGLSWTK